MTKVELANEINSILNHIQETPLSSDLSVLREEHEWCSMQLARAAQIRAEVEHILLGKRGEQSEAFVKQYGTDKSKFNATYFREYLSNGTKDEQKLFTQGRKLYQTLELRIKSIITEISLEKMMYEKSTRERTA